MRLTTNTVGCDPAAVRIGMPVHVTFAHVGEDGGAPGRGIVVPPGLTPPERPGWPVVVVDAAALAAPAPVADRLEALWRRRSPVVVVLDGLDPGALAAPEICDRAPYELGAGFTFERERLFHFVWRNNDVLDAAPSRVDGGPHGTCPPGAVHVSTTEHGDDTPERPVVGPPSGLAPDQLAAVTHGAGPARVLAPAGSGKTRVLTARIRHLVSDRAWHPGAITALAYNRRAAEEMRSRLADLGGRVTGRVRTLHAFGYAICRRAHGDLRVIDEREVRRRIEPLLDVRPIANADVYAPYIEALGRTRLALVAPEDVEDERDDVPGFADMFDRYRSQLADDRVLDHDEQIYGAIEVLLNDPRIRRAAQRSCRHMLVDEFQDVTAAQLLMIRLLAAPEMDVFAVGDDDQVIYGYAGATPEYLVRFADHFPDPATYLLEVNYRCPEAVVRAANHLLANNLARVAKAVRPGPEAIAGPDAFRVEPTGEDAAGPVRDGIAALLREGALPDDVAVLCRVNDMLLPVQLALREAGIPHVSPVGPSFLQRTGVRSALAWLRLAIALADDGLVSSGVLTETLRRPSRKLPREATEQLRRRGTWRASQLATFRLRRTDRPVVWMQEKLDLWLDDAEVLARRIGSGAETASVLKTLRDRIGLVASLDALDRSGTGADASHADDLGALIAVAPGCAEPRRFEAWLGEQLVTPDTDPAGKVMLSTVHRVKGMEWDHVFVYGADAGLFPHRLAEDEEEERRVFHVAITRGRRSVVVVADKDRPSPFVDEARGRRPPRPKPARTHAPVQAPAQPPAQPDERVREALREWRRQRARDRSVPAYVVLSDKHLDGIAAAAPSTLDGLAACPGIGPTKLEMYGDDILAVIEGARL